jgi:hypothetical protein
MDLEGVRNELGDQWQVEHLLITIEELDGNISFRVGHIHIIGKHQVV